MKLINSIKLQRYVIHLSYFGSNYSGWQIQKNSKTIQGEIMICLQKILKNNINLIVGAGRTDSGVHAKNYFAHFDYCEEFLSDSFLYSLNNILPNDIVIHSLNKIDECFHARFSPSSRQYQYIISSKKNPFLTNQAFFYFKKLDIDLMNKGVKNLIGKHCFKAFSKKNETNYICDVKNAVWKKNNEKLIFTIEANRFLHNMVRCIVGTSINLGNLKINLNQFIEIFKSQNRQNAGFSAPSSGLFLTKINYPKKFNIENI